MAKAFEQSPLQLLRRRRAAELGMQGKDAPCVVGMLYPSPYSAGMSSLGFQTLYRAINERPGFAAHRAFLPDDVEQWQRHRLPLLTYEFERPLGDYPIVAMSVAYELELAGVVQSLQLAGMPALAEERDERHPLVLAGGPLTFSNPLPLAPYVDAMLMGEADETVHQALDILFAAADRQSALQALAKAIPSCFVPSLHGDRLPAVAKCRDDLLPAYSAILTPHTELRDMFLVEAERGCSRRCEYCVMRRSTNGGMRLVDPARLLSLVPAEAKRVGLVGAAVSDHPRIAEIIESLVAQGREVGLSSLRPDRLNDRFVAALKAAGTRTLTTASDGPSQHLRDRLQRKTSEEHLLRAARLTRHHALQRMKLYMMIGLPGESDADIDELVRFASELSQIIPLSLGIAPFVAKRNTPLDGQAFAGIELVEHRLARLRAGVHGRVDLRATSARWAWVEYRLAQGGQAEGRAVMRAVQHGGRFRDWRRALDEVVPDVHRPLAIVA